MKLKIFTLRMNPATGKFDDAELAAFQSDKDVIELSEHFLTHEKTPTLVLVLQYRETSGAARQAPEAARKDWRGELDESGKRLYDELRLWRGRKAKREGIPPYLILNNRELAELSMKRPLNVTQLREIDGIGEAKSARWGEELLALMIKNQGGGKLWAPSNSPSSFIGRRLSRTCFLAPRSSPSACASRSLPG